MDLEDFLFGVFIFGCVVGLVVFAGWAIHDSGVQERKRDHKVDVVCRQIYDKSELRGQARLDAYLKCKKDLD